MRVGLFLWKTNNRILKIKFYTAANMCCAEKFIIPNGKLIDRPCRGLGAVGVRRSVPRMLLI